MQNPYDLFLSNETKHELDEALAMADAEVGRAREMAENLLGKKLPNRWFSVFKAEAGIPYVLRQDGLISREAANNCLRVGVWLYTAVRITDEILDNQVQQDDLICTPLLVLFTVRFHQEFAKHCANLELDPFLGEMLATSAKAAVKRRNFKGSAREYLEVNEEQNSYATVMAISAIQDPPLRETFRCGLIKLFSAYQVYDDYWDREEDRLAGLANIVDLFFLEGDGGLLGMLRYAMDQCDHAADLFQQVPTFKKIANQAKQTFSGIHSLLDI